MSQHHPLGPSTLERRRACPGSYHAEQGLSSVDDEETLAGMKRHAVAASGLTDRSKRVALLAELPEEDRGIVEAWWWYWDEKTGAPHIVLQAGVETPITLPGGRFGTCDAWALWELDGVKTLTVADLKGQPPGRAKYNLQTPDYARGLADTLKLNHETGIEVAIISRAGVSEWRFMNDEFQARIADIDRVVSAAQADNAQRIPGDHCARCLACESCDARRSLAVRTSALLEAIADPVAFVAALTPDQRTKTTDAINAAAKKISEAADAIKDAIRSGTLEVPGYRVIQSSRASWKDDPGVRMTVLRLAHERGLSSEDVTPLVSPSQASQMLGKDVIEAFTEKRPITPSVKRMKGDA